MLVAAACLSTTESEAGSRWPAPHRRIAGSQPAAAAVGSHLGPGRKIAAAVVVDGSHLQTGTLPVRVNQLYRPMQTRQLICKKCVALPKHRGHNFYI